MKLRRFTDAGVAKARAFLAAVKESNDVENVTLNGQPFTRAALISSPAYSDAIPALADLDLDETRTFDTTFAFCEYFDSLIHDHNPQAYREDVGFWTWLAMVYLPQLVKVKGGAVDIGVEGRIIFIASKHTRSYRHYLASPYYVYYSHRDHREICNSILMNKFDRVSEFADQVLTRQSLCQNVAVMKALTLLYYDSKSRKLVRGAGGKSAGEIRRFVSVFDQLSTTRDFHDESDAVSLLKILPQEFDRFKNRT